jgi:hypothetical protein
MGSKGREKVVQHFSVESNHQSFISLFHNSGDGHKPSLFEYVPLDGV